MDTHTQTNIVRLHSFVALGVTFDPKDNSFIASVSLFFTLNVPEDLLPPPPPPPLLAIRFHDSGSFVDVSLYTIKMIKETRIALQSR